MRKLSVSTRLISLSLRTQNYFHMWCKSCLIQDPYDISITLENYVSYVSIGESKIQNWKRPKFRIWEHLSRYRRKIKLNQSRVFTVQKNLSVINDRCHKVSYVIRKWCIQHLIYFNEYIHIYEPQLFLIL